MLHLPKSEYQLCKPPEKWVDVTGDCQWRDGNLVHFDGEEALVVFVSEDPLGPRWRPAHVRDGYRLRPVRLCGGKFIEGVGTSLIDPKPQWAFLIEKKESA